MNEDKSDINWFPGHMAKAARMILKESAGVDCFIYVLDARASDSCINPEFLKIAGTKPVLFALNKSDLVEKHGLELWLDYFKKQNLACVACDSTTSKSRREILEKLKQINSEKLKKYADRGVNKSVRAMVCGVPNGGKSTLINSLVGGRVAATGDKPGVTRGKQWVLIDKGLELLDTPGVMPPKTSARAGINLAIIGAVNDNILDGERLALEIARIYKENDADKFCARFKISEIRLENSDVLKEIAKVRGYLLGGGELDLERGAKAVIDDFRKCRIAKTILELPPC